MKTKMKHSYLFILLSMIFSFGCKNESRDGKMYSEIDSHSDYHQMNHDINYVYGEVKSINSVRNTPYSIMSISNGSELEYFIIIDSLTATNNIIAQQKTFVYLDTFYHDHSGPINGVFKYAFDYVGVDTLKPKNKLLRTIPIDMLTGGAFACAPYSPLDRNGKLKWSDKSNSKEGKYYLYFSRIVRHKEYRDSYNGYLECDKLLYDSLNNAVDDGKIHEKIVWGFDDNVMDIEGTNKKYHAKLNPNNPPR